MTNDISVTLDDDLKMKILFSLRVKGHCVKGHDLIPPGLPQNLTHLRPQKPSASTSDQTNLTI